MKTKRLVVIGLLIALSFIGANIKILESIAFDSMPAFLGTLILGPIIGAIIGAVAHFLSALTSGFPLSLPVHMIVMVDMAVTMILFGIVYNKFKNKNNILAAIAAVIVAVIINGPVSVFAIIPIAGKGVIVLLPILSLAALANVIIAIIIYRFIPESIFSKI
ncbi:ECF transporter S component [Clostridium sp. Marseille-Q2269]|uniref:ECF transporter S component n=1 Tax=Clostridium sp. Marseille-Q2269 TaxID=2942205 RepID=UPI002073AAAC|nr:ECF transporter S component [Clostridium sp. Marseille-Q2269]